jgi:hypothetical protein
MTWPVEAEPEPMEPEPLLADSSRGTELQAAREAANAATVSVFAMRELI